MGVVGYLWRLDSPGHSVAPPPPGFSATPEALQPPTTFPTLVELWATLEALQPCCRPALLSFRWHVFPTCLLVYPFVPASTHSGPALPPCWRPQREISQCRPCRPLHSPVPHLHRFIACPMELPSDFTFSPPAPLRSSRPPPYPILTIPPCSRRSTPCLCCRSPPGHPYLRALPCCRHCLSGRVPVSHTLTPPSSSPCSRCPPPRLCLST